MKNKKQKLWREITSLLDKLHDPLKRDREASRIRSDVSGMSEDKAIAFLEAEKDRLLEEMAELEELAEEADNTSTHRRKFPWPWVIGGTLAVGAAIMVALLFNLFSKPAVIKESDQTAPSLVASSATESEPIGSKEDFFKVDESAAQNMFGRLFEPADAGVADDAPAVLSGDLKQDLKLELELAAKDPEVLEAAIRNVLKKDVPKQMTVEIDGNLYMSPDARKMWKEYFLHIKNEYQKNQIKVETAQEGYKAYMDGVDGNDNYIVSQNQIDLGGTEMMTFRDVNGSVVKKSFFCGNFICEEVPPGTPRGNIPQPPKPPTPPQPAPKNLAESPQQNPEVIRQDVDNVRPGADGNENAGVNNSPGTAYQGESQADVVRQQQAEAETAAAAERQRQQQQQQQQHQHQKAQDQAQKALNQEPGGAQKDNQSKSQDQTNNRSVSGGDGW